MTPGSCSTGIHILLEELELVFHAHVISLPAGDNQTPEFLAINPKGTIPVLVLEDGRSLTDFVAIAWWLAMKHPRYELLPQSIEDQAELLGVMNDIVGNIHQQGFTRIFTTERYCQNESELDEIKRHGESLVKIGLDRIASKLEETDGYLFNNFSIADAALFYVEFWATRSNIPLPSACQHHYKLMLSRPVVKQVLSEEGYHLR